MRHLTTRRAFTLAAGTSLAAVIAAPVKAAEFDYKFAHDLPIDHPLHIRLTQAFAEIKTETKGRFDVKLFPFGQLGAGPGLIEVLRTGAVQFASTGSFLWGGAVTLAAIDAMGFIFTDVNQATKVMDGALGELVRKAFAARNLFALPGEWDLGMRQMTSSTKPMHNLADLAGFRIRTPGAKISVDLFATLGAAPTPVDSTQMYSSMQTHIVDGQETPYLTIETFKFYEVQKYLSISNHQWTAYWCAANGDAWKALPPDIQATTLRVVAKYLKLERKDVALQNAALADKLQRQGLTFNKFDPAGCRAKLAPYYGRWKAEFGPAAWDLLEAGVGKLG